MTAAAIEPSFACKRACMYGLVRQLEVVQLDVCVDILVLSAYKIDDPFGDLCRDSLAHTRI